MIAACAYAVYRARRISTVATSLVITTFNSVVPMVSHLSENPAMNKNEELKHASLEQLEDP